MRSALLLAQELETKASLDRVLALMTPRRAVEGRRTPVRNLRSHLPPIECWEEVRRSVEIRRKTGDEETFRCVC